MYIQVVNYGVGMEISTAVIANIDLLCTSLYHSSCDGTKYTQTVTIDWEWWFVFSVYILVELEQPFRIMGAIRTGDAFNH
jgi:hypothetical protein